MAAREEGHPTAVRKFAPHPKMGLEIPQLSTELLEQVLGGISVASEEGYLGGPGAAIISPAAAPSLATCVNAVTPSSANWWTATRSNRWGQGYLAPPESPAAKGA